MNRCCLFRSCWYTLKAFNLCNFAFLLSIVSAFFFASKVESFAAQQDVTFNKPVPAPYLRSRMVDYGLLPGAEKFFVWVPQDFNNSQRYGLIVYISPDQRSSSLPPGWDAVLSSRKYLFVSPHNAGNGCENPRRRGLAVLGALQMKQHYRIDGNRVFVAGLSGGARTASALGFYQTDLFKGTIQDCGSDFYRAVQHRCSNDWTDSNGNPYGVIQVSSDEISRAKSVMKFCLITGPGDFRRGNLQDIYSDGFARDGFRCRFFDVPEMGHQDCDANTLSQVLDFLER